MSFLHPYETTSPYKQVDDGQLALAQAQADRLRYAALHDPAFQASHGINPGDSQMLALQKAGINSVLPQGYRVDDQGKVTFYGDTGLGPLLTYAPYGIGAAAGLAGAFGGAGGGAGAASGAGSDAVTSAAAAGTGPATTAGLTGAEFGGAAATTAPDALPAAFGGAGAATAAAGQGMPGSDGYAPGNTYPNGIPNAASGLAGLPSGWSNLIKALAGVGGAIGGNALANAGQQNAVPPQLSQLLDLSMQRANSQTPLFNATQKGFYDMLPSFAKTGGQ